MEQTVGKGQVCARFVFQEWIVSYYDLLSMAEDKKKIVTGDESWCYVCNVNKT
jgi:hypothetical protein